MGDIPTPLVFVDPVDERWRACLFGTPGTGKTTAACSAPGPILALSADRPGAYRFPRKLHSEQEIDVAEFKDSDSLRALYAHAQQFQADIGTVVLDPWNSIYDQIVKENTSVNGKPNWAKVNDIALSAVQEFRTLDVNLVLVAHERRESDENAETEAKIFPQLGGPALVQRTMAELDIVARVFRKDPDEEGEEPKWMGQLINARGYQCKDSTGALGRMRELNLAEWFSTANTALAPDNSDLPWEAEAPTVKETLA